MRMTDEQEEIREYAASMKSTDNLKVIAFAGAGKTTTLKAVAGARKDRGIYIAFNKSIADEARRKLAMTRCAAATMHSLAYGAVREVIRSPLDLNARAVRDSGILNRFTLPSIKGWNQYRISSAISRTLSVYCNSADPDFNEDHGIAALISSVGDPDFIRNAQKRDEAEYVISRLAAPLARMAETLWINCMENQQMSHDMYLKALELDEGLRAAVFSGYRYLMVDEAQDINPVQRSIITKSGLPIVAVGDPYQQIYSWRGAENALDLLPGETKYLTQSFRFGEEIAENARKILASRPDGGPAQRLIGAGNGSISGHAGSKIGIICRNNHGMLDEAFRVLQRGVSVEVDNMKELLRDVRAAQALYEGDPRRSQSPVIEPYASWAELKTEAEEGDQTLGKLVNIIENDMVPKVEKLAQHQHDQKTQANVQICTAHRSKGLEWPAVQLGADFKDITSMKGRYKKSRTQSAKHVTLAIEEWNTVYVAATRPMLRLQGHERILNPGPEPEISEASGHDEELIERDDTVKQRFHQSIATEMRDIQSEQGILWG